MADGVEKIEDGSVYQCSTAAEAQALKKRKRGRVRYKTFHGMPFCKEVLIALLRHHLKGCVIIITFEK